MPSYRSAVNLSPNADRRSQFFASSDIPYNSDLSGDGDSGEDDEEGPVLRPVQAFLPSRAVDIGEITPGGSQLAQITSDETTPLLQGSSASNQVSHWGPDSDSYFGGEPTDQSLLRRKSSVSLKRSYNYGGQSTYGQTLLNSIAILLGIGMLSESLAFAYAGWIGGTALIIFLGFLNCYTAKILAGIILEDPCLRSYADIGRKAFGPRSTALTTTLFCLELFAVSVAFVTLAADSLHEVIPAYSADTFKILSITGTTGFPTAVDTLVYLDDWDLFNASCYFVIFIDGFSKPDAPGSLWSPAATSWGTGSMTEVGIAIGLFMAGFSGHAVVPSLARDMVDPSQFDNMINGAFVIATFIYAIIGYAGYLMFGSNVSDEISKDLMSTPGYNSWINEIVLWSLVSTPLTKFPLSMRPLNVILEMTLDIDNDTPFHGGVTPQLGTKPSTPRQLLNRVSFVVERVFVAALSIMVSILVPEFGSLMAFLGSFSAFTICVIGPISAKIALDGRCSFVDGLLLAIAIAMATWGTLATFWSA